MDKLKVLHEYEFLFLSKYYHFHLTYSLFWIVDKTSCYSPQYNVFVVTYYEHVPINLSCDIINEVSQHIASIIAPFPQKYIAFDVIVKILSLT